MRIHDQVALSWVIFGLALVFGSPLLAFLTQDSMAASPASLLFLAHVLLWGAWAAHLTLRSTRAQRCGTSARYLAQVAGELDADELAVRRQAVRTLADFYDEPFGAVCLFWCRPAQVDALCVLYREWWRATQPAAFQPGQSPAEAAARAAAANLQPPVPAVSDNPPAWQGREELADEPRFRGPLCPAQTVLDQLPRLARQEFVAALQPAVEDALLLAADLLNDVTSPATFLQARRRVPEVFADLGWEALERGWQMRFDAEQQRRLQPRQLSWAARFRRMKMAEVGLLPTPDPDAPAEPPAAGGEPGAAAWQDILRFLRGQLEEKLDRLADAIKDALLDSGSRQPAETVQEPLLPLARAEFIAAMRGRVEQALGQMADVLDQSDDAEGVREVLAELLWDALNLSARLRDAVSTPGDAAPGTGEPGRRHEGMPAALKKM